ncbi:hypothetical protein V8E54_004829 [Elaphomyces granulatus]
MSRTVLALTTTFVPPPPCLTDVYLYHQTGSTRPIATYYEYDLGPPDTSDCFPSGWEATAYFSPGVCPLGYNIACSSHNSIGTLTETTATCCPSGYICKTAAISRGTPWCSSGITSNGAMTVITTNAQGGYMRIEAMVDSGVDGINAFGIIIHYQSSDFITSTVLPTQTSIMPTSLPTTNIPSASSSSSPSTTTSTILGTTSDNTGQNIAIGVGSLVSFGILSGIFAIWFARRRQSRGPSKGPSELQ